jgi:hypothetical protein
MQQEQNNILNDIDDLIEETIIIQERYDVAAVYGAGLGLVASGIPLPFGNTLKIFDDSINSKVVAVLDPVGKAVASAIKSVANHLDNDIVNKITSILLDDTGSAAIGGAILAMGGISVWLKIKNKIRDRKIRRDIDDRIRAYHKYTHDSREYL